MKYRWSYFKQYEKQNELIYKKISKEKLFHFPCTFYKNIQIIQYKFLQLELKQKKLTGIISYGNQQKVNTYITILPCIASPHS